MSAITVSGFEPSEAPPGLAVLSLVSAEEHLAFYPSKNTPAGRDPVAEANAFVRSWDQGVLAVINACERLVYAHANFKDDPEKERIFVAILTERKILSASEARMGLNSPKLTKLMLIGELANVLRCPEILRLLEPGYTLLYEVTVLHRKLLGRADAKHALLEILTRCQGPLSRDYLISESKKLKSQGRKASNTVVQDVVWQTVVSSGRRVDMLALTPDAADMRRIDSEYADSASLGRALRVNEVIADMAVGIVFTAVEHLATVQAKLLPLCGFEKVRGVFLAKIPSAREITTSDVVLVATRGRVTLPDPTTIGRALDHAPTDITRVAEEIAPDTTSKLHVFARRATEGWSSIIGSDNWDGLEAVQ